MEMLTVTEVAALLKISKSQVYELVKERTRTGEKRINPIPAIKIAESIRFVRQDVEAWIDKLRGKVG